MYRGDVALSQILDFKFTTTAAATGIPTALSGGTLSAYKSNSVTQTTTGVTLTADFDGVTGCNHVRVDTSSDGTFYATANDFQIVITAGTVGGSSAVGYVVGEFSINNRTPLRPATAGRTLVVDAAGLADSNTVKIGPTGAGTAQTARDVGTSVLLSSGTGTGQLSLSSGKVSLASPQTVNITGDITGNLSGSVGSVSGNVAGNVVGSVGSVTGAVGSVTGNVGGNLLGTLTVTERDAISTALLKLDWTGLTGEAARSVLNALRILRNKVSTSGTTLTVTKENDSDAAWTATVTTDSLSSPIVSVDPA